MGTCVYCGVNAGFLKSKHKECEVAYNNGKDEIIESICSAITGNSDFTVLDDTIEHIADINHIKPSEIESLHVDGFGKAVDVFIDNGMLTVDDENKIIKYRSNYGFDQSVLDKNSALQKVVKASILREVLNGNVPESSLKIEGILPFLLQKSEKIIWVFQQVELYEQKTKTVYKGKSNGVSFRIAKGVYYRTGAFKGNPVSIQETKCAGIGLVALTNKHIFFASSLKNFKIPYSKIVVINPYKDGIDIQKDGANTKPLLLKGVDGWFAYNIITNLIA